jgi:hypothetical protein
MDQVTSLHDEKTIHFADPTGFDPAIDGLSVASKNFRDLRDSQIFALWRSNFCCLPAHGRPAWLFGLCFTGEESFE